MTEWKTTVDILSSSQSSIAALKNVLSDVRLASSPPFPPTTNPPSHPPTTLKPYLLGRSVGEPEGVGGEGRGAELANLPFPRKFWRTFCAKADCA